MGIFRTRYIISFCLYNKKLQTSPIYIAPFLFTPLKTSSPQPKPHRIFTCCFLKFFLAFVCFLGCFCLLFCIGQGQGDQAKRFRDFISWALLCCYKIDRRSSQDLENMSICSKTAFSVCGLCDLVGKNRGDGSFRVRSSIGAIQFKESNPTDLCLGRAVDVRNHKLSTNSKVQPPKLDPVYAQSSGIIGKSMRWWEKSLQPNMIEINSAQELVDNLLNAGDRLVIVDFYSPGCGGCRTLHPKICQLAEINSDAIFLKVNYEEHKPMCYALHVHVLPFFRFYRGAEGRVCSFSCTNATIKKFKGALAKHGADRCSIGPTKGLEESELLALASLGFISRDLVPSSNKDELFRKETDESNEDKKIGVEQGNGMILA